MKNIVRSIALFTTLLFSFPLFAQTGFFYSTDKELSNSLVNSIYQDRKGYVWIATEDGLNKFDGVRFSVYKNRQGDPTSIKNNYVRTMYEDSKGRFWIGCINGLLRYDRVSDSFREVNILNGKKLVHPHITSIAETSNGDLWITANGHGIVHVPNDSEPLSILPRVTQKLSSIFLVTSLLDKQGYLWIASEYQGLNRLNTKTGEVKIYQYPNGIGSNQISALAFDRNGCLVVGTLTNGLFRYNKASDKFDPVPSTYGSRFAIKSILLDSQNRLLVGTDGLGMMKYNEQRECLESFQLTSAPFDFSRMKVHALCQDKAGNIWVGLFQKGVFLSPNSPNKFNYIGYKSFERNKIGSSCVMSVLKDRSGQLWVGTDNDGLYAIAPNGNSRHYSPQKNGSTVSPTVMTIAEDQAGGIWLGSYLDGLAYLDAKSGRCLYFNDKGMAEIGNTSSNKVVCMAFDRKNRLWIGTNGAGVYVFNVQSKKYIMHYSLSAEARFRIKNDWISSIYCDREGVMWIGTYEGLNSVDTNRQQIKNYSKEETNLPGNVIYSLGEDRHGNIWIGTTEGLSCLYKSRNKVEVYTTNEGLADNVICGIVEDDKGDIWISSHTGISKLIVGEKRFVNYNAQDGLQGNEFSRGAAYRAASNELIFGGTNGVTTFLPSKVLEHKNIPHVSMTGLYVLDRSLKPIDEETKKVNYEGFIGDANTIYLDYNENIFSIEFSTFDFGGERRVYYRYKVDGLNANWMNTEKGVHRIGFTNLDYGSYKLRVKASIHGLFSEEKVIKIVISPPWYLSWWAKGVYLILVLMLIFGIAKYLLNKIRYKQEIMRIEHAEQINEAKLQFFINISHEIRTPMTLILSPLENLIKENRDPSKQSAYQMMYRNSQRILRLINQLMDIRKIDKGQMVLKHRKVDIIAFIDDVMETFKYQAEQRNLKFSFVHQDEFLNLWTDLNSFDKVLVNILSNAFKFTPDNGEIVISQKVIQQMNEQDQLTHYCEITVSDSGIGIEEDKIERIFERFYQIDSAQSKMFSGTGIGLHLAQSLVQLLHGKIFARNRVGQQGSEFIVQLPLGSAHLAENELEVETPLEVNEKQDVDTKEVVAIDAPVAKSRIKAKTNYRILIVDDEDEIRHYLKQELSPLYRVLESRNGKEALEIILKEKPNLVLSDVMMPEMDGITLCKKLKSNININHIPVILLTAKSDDEHKLTGFEYGADAYIVKPFNVELLKKQITNLIENRERLEPRPIDDEENKNLIRKVVIKPHDQILLEKVIKIINDNISNNELNVETLADGVGMSRVHMHRKLKELTNQSARDLIRSIRLKQAADLLANNKLTVSEVAFALGFSNLSHFSNSFREFHGVSPKEFAEKINQ